MKERPILFNAEMVKAILAGRKTQTRRIMKSDCMDIGERDDGSLWPWREHDDGGDYWYPCPLGQPGDQLWVREAWRVSHKLDKIKPSELPYDRGLSTFYAAGGSRARMSVGGPYVNDDTYPVVPMPWLGKLRPSLHMPRIASRIDLLITGVRVERLNAISESDAIAEGLERYNDDGIVYYGQYGRGDCRPEVAYGDLWQSIYGSESWQANPWVWVIEFEHLRAGGKG